MKISNKIKTQTLQKPEVFASAKTAKKIVYNSCFQLIIDCLRPKDQLRTRSLSKKLAYTKVIIIRWNSIKITDIGQILVINPNIKRVNQKTSHQYSFKRIQPANKECLAYLYENGIRSNYDLTQVNAQEIHEIVDFTQLKGGLDISSVKNLQLPNILYVNKLSAQDCGLHRLPELPNIVEYLNCAHNQITELPQLPKYIQRLICNDNLLTKLPDLSPTEYLNCSGNQLTELPDLSNLTEYLDCSSNQLIKLPNLPKLTKQLFCFDNQLTELPDLSNLTEELHCYNNNLTKLPNLDKLVNELNCANNQLTKLTNLPSLTEILYCQNNQLTELPELPNLIEYLNCSNNQLLALPNLPELTDLLECEHNQISVISIQQIPKLTGEIYCLGNPLVKLINIKAELIVLG